MGSLNISIGGKGIDFEEMTELRAVRASGDQARTAAARQTLKRLKRAASSVAEQEVGGERREIFESAGWTFALHRETTVEAARNLTSGAPEEAVRRVFRTADNQLYIESHRVIVRFTDGRPMAQALQTLVSYGVKPVRALPFAPGAYEVEAQPGQSLELAQQLGDQAELTYAEPDLLQNLPARRRPSDPFYGRQWQWRNDGSNGGMAGADTNIELAWDITTGTGTRVSVIDNGMDVEHPDIAAGISGGGYFEDDPFSSGPFIPFFIGDDGFPKGDHGTFCLGMVGARGDNNIGVVGGAPTCALMPVACLLDQVGTQTTLARAVAYSASPQLEDSSAPSGEGADVITCSLGPNSGAFLLTSVLRDAIDFAVTQGRGGLGTPVFWAVSNGNEPVSSDQVCSYENTIAVGRSSRFDLEDGSAFGPELDFLAPGVQVYSTYEGRYGHGTGTSYATPCAASIGALLLASEPGLTWTAVRDRLRDTCKKVGGDPYVGPVFGGRNAKYGFGRIDAAAALGAGVAAPNA